MEKIIYTKQFGTCKRFKILPIFWIEIKNSFKLKLPNQWCLGYKNVRIGFIELFYHSPLI